MTYKKLRRYVKGFVSGIISTQPRNLYLYFFQASRAGWRQPPSNPPPRHGLRRDERRPYQVHSSLPGRPAPTTSEWPGKLGDNVEC